MQVQLRLNLAAGGVTPLAAAGHHHRCWAKQTFQPRTSCPRRGIALDGERETVGEVALARAGLVGEGRDWGAKTTG